MAGDVGRLSRGAANHRDPATAAVLRDVPESSGAHPTPCVASDRNALALPRDHYCVRARARSGSTAPVFLPRSHDDRCADRDRFFHGSCSLSRPDRTSRPPYPTLASSIAYELAAGRAPLTWGLSHLELCGDHDLGPCGGELSDNLGVRCRIGDH
jgi:hypothetical protein